MLASLARIVVLPGDSYVNVMSTVIYTCPACMHARFVAPACSVWRSGGRQQLSTEREMHAQALQQWLRVRVHVDDSRRGYRLRLQPWMHKHRSQMHIRPDGRATDGS